MNGISPHLLGGRRRLALRLFPRRRHVPRFRMGARLGERFSHDPAASSQFRGKAGRGRFHRHGRLCRALPRLLRRAGACRASIWSAPRWAAISPPLLPRRRPRKSTGWCWSRPPACARTARPSPISRTSRPKRHPALFAADPTWIAPFWPARPGPQWMALRLREAAASMRARGEPEVTYAALLRDLDALRNAAVPTLLLWGREGSDPAFAAAGGMAGAAAGCAERGHFPEAVTCCSMNSGRRGEAALAFLKH